MSNLHQSVVDQVHARIGKTLKDKWRIDALIGVGGMAAVYAATHRTGSRVAIKMLHPALSINDSVRKRFAREGYVANTIGHSGVARVLDDDVAEDGSAFLVMELLEGETVASRAERCGGKLNPSEVAYIGEAVCDVLASAHKSNIIHRDIKPDNVFVTNDGRVVVLDFGIARLVDQGGTSGSGTRTGTMMGTPAFMPPEQARGRANEMDASSDVWALGATLFWLASGRVVHEAETPNEQLVAAATLPAASLSRFAPNFPAPISEVIDKALEFTKDNRFHDADAMKLALHSAVLSVSWGDGARPSLDASAVPPPNDGDETVVDIGVPLKPLAPRLPLSGDDAPTIDTRSARGPTIGPVEMAPAPKRRSAQYVKAGLIGLVAAVTLLGVTTLVAKKINEPTAAATTAPLATPTPTP
ncbi:MAG TPA: serine/threonine-protein kinase, partial [Polyangiaceae bacterium]|nr:serine/threonine-protein kinase [Polyangiaceae bacterium]